MPGQWPVSEQISFKKASSPDIPEPPHKKGSAQTQAQKPPKLSDGQLRRKQPDAARNQGESLSLDNEPVTLTTPSSSPKELWAGSPMLSSPIEGGKRGAHHAAGEVEDKEVEGGAPKGTSILNRESLDLAGRRILERLVLEDSNTASGSGPVKDLAAQLKLAQLLGNRGKPQAALHIAEQLELQHPNNPDVLCLHGKCFLALSNRAQASSLSAGRQ